MGSSQTKLKREKNSHFEKYGQFSYASSSMCGWRPFMQDAHLCIYPFGNQEDVGLFAVFDGHGGLQVAHFAKENLPKCLANNQAFINKDYEKALTETFLQVDQMMNTNLGQKDLQEIRNEEAKKQNAVFYEGQTIAGSTANVILITKDMIYCANIGDSRSVAAVLVEKQKLEVKELSFDHKPFHEKQRRRIQNAGGIITAQGRISNNLNLSRAFGDFLFKSNKNLRPELQMVIAIPDVIKIPRNDVKFILMGCDGIWEKKNSFKMIKWIAKKHVQYKGDLVKILEDLLEEEVASHSFGEFGMDNMTSILIQFNRKENGQQQQKN